MYRKVLSKSFMKNISQVKGKELNIIVKKIDEITKNDNLKRYKNLRYELKQYKRVHVNK